MLPIELGVPKVLPNAYDHERFHKRERLESLPFGILDPQPLCNQYSPVQLLDPWGYCQSTRRTYASATHHP